MMKAKLLLPAMLVLVLSFAKNSFAQDEKKSVTIKITKEINGQKTVIDTSFQVTRESEIDDVLEQMGVDEPKPNQSIEKQIIIRESDNDAARAPFRLHFDDSNQRPMLGVFLDDNEDEPGVRISGVSPNSGAQAAGLQYGDVLTEVAGEEVNSAEDISEALEDFQSEDMVEVVYLRDGRVNTTTVKLKSGSLFSFQAPKGGWGNHDFNYHFNYNFNDAKGLSWKESRAFLGIYPGKVAEETAEENGLEDTRGVYIEKVVGKSAAEAAGLKAGDIITHLNGEQMESTGDLTKLLETLKPGDPLEIRYVRNGKSMATTTKLGKQEPFSVAPRAPTGRMQTVEKPYLGVYLEDEEEGGVRITRVTPNTAADDAGLESGDIILGMDDFDIDSYRDLNEAMKEFEPGQEIRVRFEREGKIRRERVVLGAKTTMAWVQGDEDDDNIDINIVIHEFDDQQAGEALRRFMQSPSLNIKGFSYFPNPNNGRFRLRFELPDTGDLNIRIYNPEGKVLYDAFKQGFSGNYDEAIDISDFVSEGVLFLQITQNGKGMADKIIIR